MAKVIIQCETETSRVLYVRANYNNGKLSDFVNATTDKKITHADINVSFCPISQFVVAEYHNGKITDVKVLQKRTQEQRKANMIAIASALNVKFNRL